MSDFSVKRHGPNREQCPCNTLLLFHFLSFTLKFVEHFSPMQFDIGDFTLETRRKSQGVTLFPDKRMKSDFGPD